MFLGSIVVSPLLPLFFSFSVLSSSFSSSLFFFLFFVLPFSVAQAEEAAAIGLVNRVVDDAALEDETWALARTVASKLPAAVALGKQAFYTQAALPTAAAYDLATSTIVDNMMLPDTQACVHGFLAGRAAGAARKKTKIVEN